MTVVAIGLNHRSAPLALLEQVNFPADDVPKALTEISSSGVVSEAVIVSTCNRTEVYVHAERFHDGFRDVRDALGLLSGLDLQELDPHLYAHYHDEAARHLFEVAAGLDSVVLGEHEILGQIARAWEQARLEGTSGPLLNLLFQRAIESGKKVRTDTEIGRSTASLSHAAVNFLGRHRDDLDGASVLLVGTGDLGTDVANALCRKHPIDLRVANRTAAKAEELVARLGGRTVPLADLAQSLGDVDVLICATSAPGPIIDVDTLQQATVGGRRLLVLDLGLPRDMPSEAAELEGLELLDLAQLQAFANEGLEARREHVGAAREIVAAELDRYASASSARQVAPLIGGLHAWADGIRAAEFDRYAARLAGMDDNDREAMEALTRSLVAKLLHQPTIHLKDAAGTAKGERLAEAVRELFDQS